MSEIKLRKGETVAGALRRLKKSVDIEGVLKTLREKRYYEKPSRKKYRHKRRAKFNARLASKRENY